MSFNTLWDINKYKKDNEGDAQWILKKNFMLAHKTKFPEDKLACLAQAFCNIEFLGCVYPKRTMEQVEYLGKHIAAEYRQRKKAKLQRTFTKASDAAKSKVKATSRRSGSGVESGPSWVSAASNYNIAQQSQSKATSFSDHERQVELRSSFTNTIQKKTSVDEDDATSFDSFPRPRFQVENDERGSDSLSNAPVSSSLYVQNVSKMENFLLVKRLKTKISVLGIPLNFLLIVDSIDSKNYINILDQSSREAKMELDYTFLNMDGKILCEVYLMGNLVGLGTDHSKVLSKQAAARKAVNQLKKHHYSLMKKAQFVNSGAVLNTKSGGSGTGEETLLSGNNIGLQMMKKMGWTGSGLGQNQQGIVEPIQTEQMNSRAGFGIDGSVETQQTIRNKFYGIFKDYACSDAKTDLVFSADLSSFERKLLHELARKFNLKSKSFGKGQNRKLVVSKTTKPQQILYDLLLSGQKENEKYILIEPEGV